MSNDNIHSTHGPMSNRLVLTVWTWLLVLTGFEVFLAYVQVGLALMLTLLMGFSIVKAALIIAYFMHLRFEKRSLILTLMPAVIITISLMAVFFADSLRILDLGL